MLKHIVVLLEIKFSFQKTTKLVKHEVRKRKNINSKVIFFLCINYRHRKSFLFLIRLLMALLFQNNILKPLEKLRIINFSVTIFYVLPFFDEYIVCCYIKVYFLSFGKMLKIIILIKYKNFWFICYILKNYK